MLSGQEQSILHIHGGRGEAYASVGEGDCQRSAGVTQVAGGHKEAFTCFVEHASWDVSELVLDLETKAAELFVLQALLAQKENKICVWTVLLTILLTYGIFKFISSELLVLLICTPI